LQLFGGTPHQESEDMIRKLEGTRNVQGCYVAKTKTQQICRSQVIDDSWWVWNSRMAARLNLWTSTFKVMDWFMKPGKYPNWKTISATISTHDVLWIDLCDPTTHADCEKNLQIAPAALELSRVGPAVKIAESGLVTNGCHIS